MDENASRHEAATASYSTHPRRPQLLVDAFQDSPNHAILRAGGTLEKRGEFAPGYPFACVRDLDEYTVEIWFE
jgi:hypothetical protein